MNKFTIVSLFFFSMLIINQAQAEIFKCKNKEGVINFTSIPCGKKENGIKIRVKKNELNEDGTKKTTEQIKKERLENEKVLARKTKAQQVEENKRKAKLQEHKKRIKQNCDKAKNDLTRYKNPNSEDKKNMTDDERKSAQKEAQRQISYWCRN